MTWRNGVWRETESSGVAALTAGLYGEEYETRRDELDDLIQGTRNDVADALRKLAKTISMGGQRVFDVDVLADMIERGVIAPRPGQCTDVRKHAPHEWNAFTRADGEALYRRCGGHL